VVKWHARQVADSFGRLPVPSSDVILTGLASIANGWRPLAIGWHAVAAVWLVAMAWGWRPSKRMTALMLTLPLASVSAAGWTSHNVFNGTAFGVLTLALGWQASRLSAAPAHSSSRPLMIIGGLLLAFGWSYPHFLTHGGWTYLYAAPLGVLPCPTLSAVIGVTLLQTTSEAKAWSVMLPLFGMAYGLIGLFRLGVTIDVALLAGASVAAGRLVDPTAIAFRRFVSKRRASS
jgi:hypothetical protein